MNNTLGGVYIEVRGDLSKLQGDFAAAEALAVRAGGAMSQGLNQASVGADKVVVAIGRLAGVIEQQSAAMSLAFQRNIATLANFEQGVRKVGASSEGTVPQMAAVSGAIRTAFGEQSIRAVERFLTLIPGVGQALQFAFPVIGAIALYESISRVLDKSDQLKAAEKELADAVTQTDNAMREQSQTVDRLRAKSMGREFGPAAEQEAQARAMRQQALDWYEDINKLAAANKQAVVDWAAAHPMRAPLSTDDWSRIKQVPEVQEKIKANEEKIDELTAKSTAKIAEAYDLMAQSARTRTQEIGALAVKRIEAEQQASQRATEISRQRYTFEIDAAHAAEQQRIAGMVSEYARVVATGNEEIRFEKAKQDEIAGYALATRDRTIKEIAAKAGAESSGKSTREQALISVGAQGDTQKAKDDYALAVGKAALDVQKSQSEAALKLDELNRRVAETLKNDVREGWDTVKEAAHRSQQVSLEAETADLQAKTRVAEIEAKGAGETRELDIERQKIALEGQYAQTIFKTAAGHIAYLQQIAKLDKEAADAKINGLKAELAIAQSEAESVRGTEAYVAALEKVARLKVQIANAQGESGNQQAKAQGGITAAENQNRLGYQIGQEIRKAFAELPQRLGTALAGGIFGKGHDVGKEVGDALKNTGKQLFGAALSSGIEKLASMILVQTGLQAAFNALFPTATAAQVIATTANTGALIANTIAVDLNTFIPKPFGFADGTESAPGGMAMVGEKGPELMYVPRGAQIIPNHRLGHFADGVGSFSTSSFSTSVQSAHFHGPMHFHGVQSVDGMMQQIALRVKTASPRASKYAR